MDIINPPSEFDYIKLTWGIMAFNSLQ